MVFLFYEKKCCQNCIFSKAWNSGCLCRLKRFYYSSSLAVFSDKASLDVWQTFSCNQMCMNDTIYSVLSIIGVFLSLWGINFTWNRGIRLLFCIIACPWRFKIWILHVRYSWFSQRLRPVSSSSITSNWR